KNNSTGLAGFHASKTKKPPVVHLEAAAQRRSNRLFGHPAAAEFRSSNDRRENQVASATWQAGPKAVRPYGRRRMNAALCEFVRYEMFPSRRLLRWQQASVSLVTRRLRFCRLRQATQSPIPGAS